MEKTYNILILSNLNDNDAKEDEIIAESFRKEGHSVMMEWIDYNEGLDNEIDIVLMRNIWTQNKEEIQKFEINYELLNKRLEKKQIKKINFNQIDSKGKEYLIKLYKKGLPVIPSFDKLEEIEKISGYEYFILKPIISNKSAIGQIEVNKEKLKKNFEKGMLIQPKIKFKSEVQCYFVGNQLMYNFEFIPSKYPNYPKPILIDLTNEEREIVNNFVKEINFKYGFLRIDFLRLENKKLLLLEIEATSPFMALKLLNNDLRNKVIEEYKKNIYEYLNNN